MIDEETHTTDKAPSQRNRRRTDEEIQALAQQYDRDVAAGIKPPEIPRTAAEKQRDLMTVTAAAAVMGLALGGIAHMNNPDVQADYQQKLDALKEKARIATITEATKAQYYSDSLIGDPFAVSEGGGLLDPALTVLHDTLGDAEFNNVQQLIYGTLRDSAFIQTDISQPRPGDTFAVVATDLDPDSKNGNEYVIVDPSTQVIYTDLDEIATPETH